MKRDIVFNEIPLRTKYKVFDIKDIITSMSPQEFYCMSRSFSLSKISVIEGHYGPMCIDPITWTIVRLCDVKASWSTMPVFGVSIWNGKAVKRLDI